MDSAAIPQFSIHEIPSSMVQDIIAHCSLFDK
jgi:hypothetical protein